MVSVVRNMGMNTTCITIIFISSIFELFFFLCLIVFGLCYSARTTKDEQIEDLKTKNEELERQNKELRKLVKKNDVALERGNDYAAKDCRNLIYGKQDPD